MYMGPNSDRIFSPYSYCGENLWAHSLLLPTATNVTAPWFSEYVDYNYYNKSCTAGKVCDHYTQVAWAATTQLGCGRALCPSNLINTLNMKTIVVCHYCTAGNYKNDYPYLAPKNVKKMTELFLHEIDGDLFTYCNSSDWKETVPSQVNIPSNNDNQIDDNFKISKSMCHCVSVDLNMGAGIAVIFKKKYGCVDGLKEQGAKIGEMATLYVPSEEMVVYYLVTKERYFHIPTYESLKSSLSQMKEHMMKHNIVNLAMPQIGIGLDKLEWEKVKEILNELFSDTGIKITVYRYKEGNTQVKSAFRKE